MGFLSTLFSGGSDAESIFQQAFEEETRHNNFGKALKLYEKAAKQGFAKAQYYCGFMYLKGRGTRRDFEKALKLVQKSAQQNYPHGQFLLAQMYLSGEGILKNEQLGNEWMEKFSAHKLPNGVTLHFHNY